MQKWTGHILSHGTRPNRLVPPGVRSAKAVPAEKHEEPARTNAGFEQTGDIPAPYSKNRAGGDTGGTNNLSGISFAESPDNTFRRPKNTLLEASRSAIRTLPVTIPAAIPCLTRIRKGFILDRLEIGCAPSSIMGFYVWRGSGKDPTYLSRVPKTRETDIAG